MRMNWTGRRIKTPCDAGFVCPYWGHDEDGMGLCKCPDITERGGVEGKKGRFNLYQYIGNLEMCPIVFDDSPIDKWLKSMDKEVKE